MTKVAVIDRIVLGVVGVLSVMALFEFVDFVPSEGDRAAKVFTELKNSGASETQLCRSARAVQDAYAAERDAAQEESWESWATTHCLLAAFKEGYQDLRLAP